MIIDRPRRQVNLPLVGAGDRIRFMGLPWTVSAILYTRDWRPFLSLVGDHGEVLEFIAADGSDGPYELLEPATGEASGHVGPGEPDTELDVAREKQPGASPVVVDDAIEPEATDSGTPSVAEGAKGSGPSLPASIASPIPDRFTPQPWRP